MSNIYKLNLNTVAETFLAIRDEKEIPVEFLLWLNHLFLQLRYPGELSNQSLHNIFPCIKAEKARNILEQISQKEAT